MNKYITFVCLAVMMTLTCCKQNNEVSVGDGVNTGLLVNVIERSGDVRENYPYYALPFNLAESRDTISNDSLFIVLGERIEKEFVGVEPFGKLTLDEEGDLVTYIISCNSETKEMNFDDFITDYSSIKWMIEQYMTSYKGIGKVKLIKWQTYSDKFD